MTPIRDAVVERRRSRVERDSDRGPIGAHVSAEVATALAIAIGPVVGN